jgi:hypothetical protein
VSEADLPQGWDWLESDAARIEPPAELCRCVAACFGGPSGRLLLRHLRRLFADRRLPPSATDAELRHVEGQRSVVSHLLQLLERGRGAVAAADLTLPGPKDLR